MAPAHPARRPSAGARRAGYGLAIVFSTALLIILNGSPGWQAIPFLTGGTAQVLWLVNLCLAAGIAANLVYLAYDPPWLKSLGDLATTGIGLAAAIRVWQVFPLTCHRAGQQRCGCCWLSPSQARVSRWWSRSLRWRTGLPATPRTAAACAPGLISRPVRAGQRPGRRRADSTSTGQHWREDAQARTRGRACGTGKTSLPGQSGDVLGTFTLAPLRRADAGWTCRHNRGSGRASRSRGHCRHRSAATCRRSAGGGAWSGNPQAKVGGTEMLITTTPAMEGHPITGYLGVVTAQGVLGVNAFKDVSAGMRNIFGGRARSYENELASGVSDALAEMERQAVQLGADAVVGVDIDYETAGNNMLMVSASGTAVKPG